MAFFRQPGAHGGRNLQGDLFYSQLVIYLRHELVDHFLHNLQVQGIEMNRLIQAIAKFRAKHFFNRFFALGSRILVGIPEANGLLAHFPGSGIGGHHQNHISEICLFPVVVSQGGMIHDLQQDVEQIRMRFFDLIEQQDAVGMFADPVGEQSALVKTDIAGGSADQPRHGMLFHVLTHVKAKELHPEDTGHLARNLGLADTGRTGKQKTAHRTAGGAQAGTGALDGGHQGPDSVILAEDYLFQAVFELLQFSAIRSRHALGGNACHFSHNFFNISGVDFFAVRRTAQSHKGAGLIDDIDGLVRQVAVIEILGGKLHGRLQGRIGVHNAVVFFVAGSQPL